MVLTWTLDIYLVAITTTSYAELSEKKLKEPQSKIMSVTAIKHILSANTPLMIVIITALGRFELHFNALM